MRRGGGKRWRRIQGSRKWRQIPGLSRYEIDPDGTIRRRVKLRTRAKGSIVLAAVSPSGHKRIKLVDDAGVKKMHGVHRLVALAYIGPPPSPKHEAAHNDGNPDNDHYTNLRWATRAENHADMKLHGTSTVGEKNGRAKLTWALVRNLRQEFARMRGPSGRLGYRGLVFLCRKYHIGSTTLYDAVKGRRWRVA